jgi:Putative Flp pilus-assembly TadE/G-like
MRRVLRRIQVQSGQVFVLTAVGMVGICGVAGFSIDVSSWYQTQRKQQAVADAAALAASGDLPVSTALATADAQAYATKNGGSVGDVSYSTTYQTNDTVTVRASTTAPSFFLRALGINQANVSATAKAVAVPLGSAWGSAPFAIYYTQQELSGPGCPCFGRSTQLQYNKVGPGGFMIINIDGSSGPSGQTTLANWILNGCSCSTTTPVWLWGDPGAKFNSSEVNAALAARLDSNLLFPVYDNTQAGGSNMQYHVIAFVGFHVTDFRFNGSNNGSITGYFVKVNWKGTGGNSNPGPYSATTSQLIG